MLQLMLVYPAGTDDLRVSYFAEPPAPRPIADIAAAAVLMRQLVQEPMDEWGVPGQGYSVGDIVINPEDAAVVIEFPDGRPSVRLNVATPPTIRQMMFGAFYLEEYARILVAPLWGGAGPGGNGKGILVPMGLGR